MTEQRSFYITSLQIICDLMSLDRDVRMAQENKSEKLPPNLRYFFQVVVVLLAIGLLISAASIPFVYQSTTMWYKFGFARTLLYTGKVVGILTATLLFLQILLVAKLKVLNTVFSQAQLIRQHKINGALIAGLAIAHPFLIVASEGFTVQTLEMRSWPEFIGFLLLLFIWLIFTTSQWRNFFRLSFHSWRLLHRITVPIAVFLLTLHVLFVSDSFQAGRLPRYAVFTALGLFLITWLRIRLIPLFKR